MIEVMIFLILTLLALGISIRLLVLGVIWVIRRIRRAQSRTLVPKLIRSAVALGVLLAFNAGLVLFSQVTASTPAIRDAQGHLIDGSVAELKQLDLNGRKQWISIRGQSKDNPVLLFLAGGPGGSQMAAVRHDLAALEQHFVVVNWDQPGAGKSYYATGIKELTPETYIEDGYALTRFLCESFGQEKIYLLGESWGSALGIFLIDRYPDSYHGFIGTGQMVDFVQTEILDYHKAMELAKAANDTKIIRQLEANGVPPYSGDVTWKSAVYLNYLSASMSSNPEIQNAGYNTLRDIFSEEYGLLDKINYVRGVINTYNQVYPQLYGIDLRTEYAQLQVPVYFFVGRHDINAPTVLAEEYAEVMTAPFKELVWFEHSGHSPWINESRKFVQELLRCFGVG